MLSVSGWDVFVLLGALVFSTPFIAVGIAIAFLLGRRIKRRVVAALVGGVAAVAILWALLLGVVAALLAREAGKDDDWWVRLVALLTYLSVLVFPGAALAGWIASAPKRALGSSDMGTTRRDP